MKIIPQKIDGLNLIELTKFEDERGYFARSFCEDELVAAGHPFKIHQTNVSYNKFKNTLRGMHYQAEPKPDPKIVRCVKGSVYDVVVDLRETSDSYLEWVGVTLSDENDQALLIPAGCAHGFLTLSDDATLLYYMGEVFDGDLGRGVRWNDPAFEIKWPDTPVHMNDRDANYPDYKSKT